MSLKVKLISAISLFILMLGALILGVFAASQQTITMQGNITFNVPDRSLYVKAVRYQATGEEAIDVTSFSQGYINENFNLDLTSLSQAEPNKHGSFTLYFDIINATNMQWAIERVTLSETLISEGVTESHSGIIEVNELAETDSEGFKVFDVATAPYDTLSLTITAPRASTTNPLDLSDITITINEYIPPEITDFTFVRTSDNTGAVASYTGTETEVEIPETFSVITEELETPGYTEYFANITEYNTNLENSYSQAILSAGFYSVSIDGTESTPIKDGSSFLASITEQHFPMTIEFTDYTITYEDSQNYLTYLYAIIRPIYEIMGGRVETATIELGTGEVYNVNDANMMEIGEELIPRSYSETDFPIEISYPNTRNIYVEGDDYQVTSIGDFAFEGCSGLTSITIPKGVTSIGGAAFRYCSGLTKVDYLGTLVDWCAINFSDSDSNPTHQAEVLYIQGEKLISLTIPEGVTSIGSDAFSGCSRLESINLPSTLTSIGYYAFADCSGLTNITIPSSVTSIGNFAFYNCSGLTNVSLSSTLTSIGQYAFENCSSLADVTIPSSVTNIGLDAFYNCTNLATVYIDSSDIVNEIINSSSYGYLTQYATTLYIKDTITVTTAPSGWTQDPNGSDQAGYNKYIKN